ncbi:RasGEFN [Geosmithia morbida]|uniref:RasGEFN n=1 Tax=Geosmithia morbida TaxID=1094350 RepID=A0A9P5D4R5_9HYPO|nr:RasGEFN [Geosmithia morbida]KAF4126377.1 RasGEFN [Geosmithia morbida]
MEVVGASASSAPPAAAGPAITTTTASQRKPSSSKRSARDDRIAKSSTRVSSPRASPRSAAPRHPPHATRAPSRSARGPARPLVPVTERRSQGGGSARKPSRDADVATDRWDMVPDGSSAGREGRHFTVAKVGNNGRLYLRPTVRPAQQRYPQPNFTFPATPPATASLENAKANLDAGSELWSPTTQDPPQIVAPAETLDSVARQPTLIHRRALSDSTVPDTSSVFDSAPGGFKVVISKPGNATARRPRSAEDPPTNALPHLDISIPSWRIGVPRFTEAGTPLLQASSYASSYARSDDVQSVAGSAFDRPQRRISSTPPLPSLSPGKPSTPHAPQSRLSRPQPHRSIRLPTLRSPLLSPPSPRFPHPLRATFMSATVAIHPDMYDALTFPPACDDRSVVRYGSGGAVTAATPARLVAEITSPSFLDYELISDFFLTFRAFLDPQDLLRMLIARLRWAVSRNDEIGMIVHVRGFVAMRHWVLNYFVDDFVVDYGLRLEFCKLLNGLVDDLAHLDQAHKVQLKALNEMKKCWRRACAQYWDGAEFDEDVKPEEPITPGGAAGDRDSRSVPPFWGQDDAQPPAAAVQPPMGNLAPVPESTAADFVTEQPHAGRVRRSAGNQRPSTPDDAPARTEAIDQDFGPFSPSSLASLDIVSCSFPGKHLRFFHPQCGRAMGAHPASTSSVHRAGPVASTPKALAGKRVRAKHPHGRSSSLPENPLEEEAAECEAPKADSYVGALPPGASLVRGDVLPPGQAYVQMAPGHDNRQTTFFYPDGVGMRRPNWHSDPAPGAGMKRFIGSVRRVLGTRGQHATSPQGRYVGGTAVGRCGGAVARLPGTAVVPQGHSALDGPRPRLRIDILAAQVTEDFKTAVREDAQEAAGNRTASDGDEDEDAGVPTDAQTGAQASEPQAASDALQGILNVPRVRPSSDGGLTGGSKSIVIVDDTVPVDSYPLSHGGFMTANPSVEAFADALMRNGAEITPPMTPPADGRIAAARRSSYLLNEHVAADAPLGALPPFVPDWNTIGRSSIATSAADGPDIAESNPQRDAHRPPPVSGALAKMHRRNRSSRSRRSLSLTVRRPIGSSSSGGMAPPSITHSFAGTSYTHYSMTDSDVGEPAPVPEPLRMLRRRPGGDLRAATNVDDLNQQGPRRSRSLGSLTAFSDSMCGFSRITSHVRRASTENTGSVLTAEDYHHSSGESFSVGRLADKPSTRGKNVRTLSLYGTYSSRPVMRPSFEAEAERLAQIPDDEDDGGVESALLKLEGKYEGPSSKLPVGFQDEAPELLPESSDEGDEDSEMTSVDSKDCLPRMETEDGHQDDVDDDDDDDDDDWTTMGGTRSSQAGGVLLEPPGASVNRQQSFLTDRSGESYTSTPPPLGGGLSDDGRGVEATSADWNHRSILQDEEEAGTPEGEREPVESQHTSLDSIQKTEPLDMIIKPGGTAPRNAEEQSFLDSDLSSELSDDGEDGAELPVMAETSPRTLTGGVDADLARSLPSPPNSHSRKLSPHVTAWGTGGAVPRRTDVSSKPLPPTPEPTPGASASFGSPLLGGGDIGSAPRTSMPEDAELDVASQYAIHMPFILAFDSETLAQQFTLIEKDALNEIDWKELVDMDWRNATNKHSRSWVDFLRNSEAQQGVEVVIARFNLVVKWAVSEIVLTQSIEERARCIIKLIHMASFCRHYRNFATLAQLTIALSSNEISRLAKTWDLVPAGDMKILRDLETLVTPMRNFFNLRAEMESGPEVACIPFVGIYTHDLLYNAQRPSEIASSPNTPPLINFERCRMGAAVIKTLLRLLEASSRYTFQPIEGVTERCLWIGALSDAEIRRHSGNLE